MLISLKGPSTQSKGLQAFKAPRFYGMTDMQALHGWHLSKKEARQGMNRHAHTLGVLERVCINRQDSPSLNRLQQGRRTNKSNFPHPLLQAEHISEMADMYKHLGITPYPPETGLLMNSD